MNNSNLESNKPRIWICPVPAYLVEGFMDKENPLRYTYMTSRNYTMST